MNYLDRGSTTEQVFQMLRQLVCKLWSMLFFGIFVIPDDCAASFFNDGAVNILTVFSHNLTNCLHPLLIMNFEEFTPLFFVFHQPVATFSSNPKVFKLHKILIKDAGDIVSVSIWQNHYDIILVIKDFLDPENYLRSWAHLRPAQLLKGKGFMVYHN